MPVVVLVVVWLILLSALPLLLLLVVVMIQDAKILRGSALLLNGLSRGSFGR